MEDIFNQVLTYIIAIAPSIAAIATAIMTFIRLTRDFKKLSNSVEDNKVVKELQKRQEETDLKLNSILSENIELKKALRKTCNKIDHIHDKGE